MNPYLGILNERTDLYKESFTMEDTAIPSQAHPILDTLRSDIAALAAEAINLRDKQINRKCR